ncbi:MAG: glutamine--fructose-6-phosphate transaminase (isomerizing) [Acidimicrobiales bacterium]
MCGIIGITTRPAGPPSGTASGYRPGGTGGTGDTGGAEDRRVLDVLLEGLSRLEYRGYDSAGLALVGSTGSPMWRARAANGTRSLDNLAKRAEAAPAGATAGIGHTRWATHGRPSEENAHPHVDCSGQLALVHNGIIENHVELADELIASGHRLESETDTEVLAHLVESALVDDPGASLATAVRTALAKVRGAFSLASVHASQPDLIVAARRVSPLLLGVNDSEAFLASDVPAILGLTRDFFVLEDDQIAELRPGSVRVVARDGTEVRPARLHVDWDLDAARKDGYDDYMSKEMHEQPKAVADTLLDRLLPDGTLALDEVHLTNDEFRSIDKVFIVACGSSYHAGLMAKYAIEHWARVPVEIDISSEFRYRDPVLDSRTLVIGVSQSGETVDTFQAVREAHRLGAKVLVISNVVDSSMARESDAVLYTRAGPEVGVASTKTHLAQITALQILALYLAQARGTLSPTDARGLLRGIGDLPHKVALALDRSAEVETVARRYRDSPSFIFLGRHVGYPVALEGALKLKEISYVRAEGFPGGELKHGPIALVEPGTVVIAVVTRTPVWEKMMANVAEVKSRGATVVLVANDGDDETARGADAVLWVPEAQHLFSPVVNVVPLQMFAYHLARLHGHDVDRPRNLAKVVTVE